MRAFLQMKGSSPMAISNRYREISREVDALLADLGTQGLEQSQGPRKVARALKILQECLERVGDIPRMRLEAELTPVLISAHKQLDWARLQFEEEHDQDRAAAVWDLEQKVYRLLNDL